MSFVDVVYSDTPESVGRQNLTPYRAVFDQLKIGKEATVPVDTGDFEPATVIRSYKDKDGNVSKKEVENPNAGRGVIELDHEKGFRKVAKERNVGLTVLHQHMPNGKTILTLRVGKKREFTPEAIRKRALKLEEGRAEKAGLSLEDYRKQVAERKAAEDAAKVAAEKPAPGTPAPAPTPAKATPAKATAKAS